jgi:predicted AlkP superfamily pyrophosphatase or phosphodiesterase
MQRLSAIALFALATLSACARQSQPALVQQGAPMVRHGRITDHVIVVSIDGLRADAIESFNAPTLERLMREGRYSLSAQTIPISSTLPAHTSMLSGVGSDVHGITWDHDMTAKYGFLKVPTMFSVVHAAGFRTAAVFSKEKFRALEVPGTLDEARAPSRGLSSPWGEDRVLDYVNNELARSPNLMFVHLSEPDFIGHQFGWMGHLYGDAVREADRGVARLIAEADSRFGAGRYTLIVTADHGGHGKRHGTADPRDMTIPWIVWGQGVQPGDTLTGIHTMDTAATALWLLGVDAPLSWTGRPVMGAFAATVANRQ